MTETVTPVVAPQLDLEECEDWLNQALDCHGFVNITSPVDNFRGRFFNVASPEFPQNALTYIEHLDRQEPKGIYLRVTSTSEVPETGRGGVDISLSLPSLWLDMDIAGPGHKSSKKNPMPLPATESDCWHILNHAKVPAPTLWIHSGGGLYPYWFFKHPIDISDPAVRAEWDTLSEALHLTVHRAAADLGFRYDMGTHDLARVLRIPGTVNRKVPNAPTQARSFHSDDSSKTYVPADLRAGILDALELWPDTTPVRVAPVQPARQINPGDLSPGDDFNARVDFFRDILEPIGWQFHSQRGEEVMLTRPGKSVRDGESATLNYKGSGKLYVFSTDTDFPVEEPISAFHAYALMHHNADHTSAARDLRRQGYGTQRGRSVSAGFGGTTALTVPPISSNGHREHVSAVTTEADGEVIPPDNVPPQPPLSPHIEKLPLNDSGNAARVVKALGSRRLLMISAQNKWAIYNGRFWELDSKAASITNNIIKDTLNEYFHEEYRLHSDEQPVSTGGRPRNSERQNFNAFSTDSLNQARLSSCRKLLAGMPGMYATLKAFDSDPFKLNVKNGYLDLRTGTLEPHSPDHRCMAMVPVNYNPNAAAPLWEKCLNEWHPDTEVRDYLQRVTGYTMSGLTSEHAFWIHTGKGSNGKSVFFNMMRQVMGSLSQAVPRHSLMERRSEGANADFARMAGKRLLLCSELRAKEVLDSAAVKGLTGKDVQVARQLYGDWEEFTPTGKLHFVTNHPPGMPDDDATWRRVHVFRWQTKITGDQVDLDLEDKLGAEGEGILAWAVRGFMAYREQGMNAPEAVRMEVKNYREQEDLFGEFLADCVEVLEPQEGEPEVRTPTRDLHEVYMGWAEKSGIRYPMVINKFSGALTDRDFKKWRTADGRGFVNIRLKPAAQNQWIVSRTTVAGFRY